MTYRVQSLTSPGQSYLTTTIRKEREETKVKNSNQIRIPQDNYFVERADFQDLVWKLII